MNDAINTMVKIVETRDPYTAGHQQRVADLAIAIASEMKLEDTRIDQLRTAAIVHDIGKMYIPSDILSRPGTLSEFELSLVKTHAQYGYDIIKGMDFPCSIAQAVLQHHERLDGSGYPNGLKAEDMLLKLKYWQLQTWWKPWLHIDPTGLHWALIRHWRKYQRTWQALRS